MRSGPAEPGSHMEWQTFVEEPLGPALLRAIVRDVLSMLLVSD